MASDTSSRAKPRLNVAAIGPAGGGKTALMAAILKVQARSDLAEAIAYADIDNLETSCFEYETQGRHYTHVDCDGSGDADAELIANIAQMDGLILVVAALDGVMAQTREHVLFAQQLGLNNLIVYLNKCDAVDDGGALDMVEMEVRDLLGKYMYNGSSVPVIRGAAQPALDGDAKWEASIGQLLGALDRSVPEPVRELDKPFLMSIEEVDAADGGEVTATGRIGRGVVKVGDEVEVVGSRGSRKVVVSKIDMFDEPQDSGQAGDYVDCQLRGISVDAIESGEVLAHPGSIAPRVKIEGEVQTLKREEGGNRAPITPDYRLQFSVRSGSVMGTLRLPEGIMMVMPGDAITLTIELDASVALEEQMRFALIEAEDEDDEDPPKVVGVGVVTRIVA
jgi:elongation factor Tu